MFKNCSTSDLLIPIFVCFFLLCIQSKNASSHNLTKCFHTVTHYHSNPSVSKSSRLGYTYKNKEFSNATFELICENDTTIYLELVKLSLPAREEDFCLESKYSNYTTCKQEHQCDCCELPNERCSKTVTERYEKECNKSKNCTIEISSDFLKDCPGREYSCGKRCHSRWAEVIYSCNFIDEAARDSTDTATSTLEHNTTVTVTKAPTGTIATSDILTIESMEARQSPTTLNIPTEEDYQPVSMLTNSKGISDHDSL